RWQRSACARASAMRREISWAPSCVVIRGAKRLDAVEQRAGMFRRQHRVAGQRGIKIGIRHLDQAFELRQFGVGEISDFGVGKAAEDEVHFPGAAMPTAE